jgi:hypothetical protein
MRPAVMSSAWCNAALLRGGATEAVSRFDERSYEKGIKVSDAEMADLDITGDAFHPEWNYTIKPRCRQIA